MEEKTKTEAKNRTAKTKPDKVGLPKSNNKIRNERSVYLASLMDGIPDALISTDMDFNVLEWNAAAENIYGWPTAEILGHSIQKFIQSEFHNTNQDEVIQALLTQGIWKGEVTQKRRDGSLITVLASVSVIRDPTGTPVGYIFNNRDISELTQAEQNLKFYTSIVESATDAIVGKTIEGIILSWNPAAERLYGYKAEEVIGKSIMILSPPGGTDDIPAILKKLRQGERIEHYETERISKDGRHIQISLTVSPILDNDGHVIGASAISQDITERRQVEKTIREEQEKAQGYLNIAGVVMLAVDRVGTVTMINKKGCELLGYSSDEIIGKDWIEAFLPEHSRQEMRKVFHQLIAENIQKSAYYENPVIRKDGEERLIAWHNTLVRDSDGKIITSLSSGEDITERRKAEAQIQRQLKQLGSLREIDLAIISSFDLANTLDVVLQKTLSQLKMDAAAILLFNSQTQSLEYASSLGFRSDAFQHTLVKLSESYAGRAAFERQTVHVESLMEMDNELNQALQAANEEFVEYYGTPLIVKGELKGVLEVYHRSPLNPDAEWLDFLELFAGQAAIAIDNAQLFEGLQRANAELEGRVARRTAELNQLNLELQYANLTKDKFLANMSHELRTPLNGILGLTEVLLEQNRGPLNEKQEIWLKAIDASGRHLLELINDILDISKIEAGKLDLHLEVVNANDICNASLLFVQELANKKHLELVYQKTANFTLQADPRRLKQILVNLLTNAVKYTPEKGRVTLNIQVDREQGQVHFSVIDTGIGIAAEDLKLLFQPFVQVDSSFTRRQEGTGLGLSLVQRLTEMHAGMVQVESEVGRGSRFTVSLPWKGEILPAEVLPVRTAAGVSIMPVKELQPAPGSRGTLLLAEDNEINVMVVADFLESHAYKLVIAQNGSEALKKAEETNPDLILMDMQMPVMDGLEATRRLRANPHFSAIPIIALTALAMPGDLEQCLQAGANDYMSKPINLNQLLKMIEDLLDKNGETANFS